MGHVNKKLGIALITMLLFIIGVSSLLTHSLSPYKQARAETIELAQRRADLAKAEDFYWYNGDETFFTVTGTNKDGSSIVVIVQQDGGAIEVFNQDEIVTENEVVVATNNRENPKKVLEARIGVQNDQPVWEVSFQLENDQTGYSYFSLTSGEWLQTIKNI